MNAAELSRLLADQAQRVVEHLLPAGKRHGEEWKAGGVDGSAGQSLSVRLSGSKRGVWKDFATEEGGDLLDLWMAVHGLTIAEAMDEARSFLGVHASMPTKASKAWARPTVNLFQRREQPVVDWLLSRGLTKETIAAFKIAQRIKDGKTYAVFPYFKGGELVNAKSRNIEEKKDMRQEAGAEPCLFGWHLVADAAREIVICEGEIDAMTMYQMGFPAVSVNAGAGNHQWIESDWERLQTLRTIYLCYDNDDAGRKGASEVAMRLGNDRCRMVELGAKDANQWLQDGATQAQFAKAILDAKTMDPTELRSIADFMDGVKALLFPTNEQLSHCPDLRLGHLNCGAWFTFRPSEVSIWTGYNGHGKSLLLSQVLLGIAEQKQRVCVFSGEMTPEQQGRRMVKQASGVDVPTRDYIDAIGGWLQDRVWLFNVVGSTTVARLCEVFAYAAKRYGITHFVVDSLMMLDDVPEDGPSAHSKQKAAIQAFKTLAKSVSGHVHIVAHPRKGKDEDDAPGKMDVSGSSKITDGADNVFTVWSARRDADDPDPDKPDAFIELQKQRNGDIQHRKTWLWFNRGCYQFSGNSKRKPYSYVWFRREEKPSGDPDTDLL